MQGTASSVSLLAPPGVLPTDPQLHQFSATWICLPCTGTTYTHKQARLCCEYWLLPALDQQVWTVCISWQAQPHQRCGKVQQVNNEPQQQSTDERHLFYGHVPDQSQLKSRKSLLECVTPQDIDGQAGKY